MALVVNNFDDYYITSGAGSSAPMTLNVSGTKLVILIIDGGAGVSSVTYESVACTPVYSFSQYKVYIYDSPTTGSSKNCTVTYSSSSNNKYCCVFDASGIVSGTTTLDEGFSAGSSSPNSKTVASENRGGSFSAILVDGAYTPSATGDQTPSNTGVHYGAGYMASVDTTDFHEWTFTSGTSSLVYVSFAGITVPPIVYNMRVGF